ncbi:MAG TPA: glycosyltransferase family 2 protein [Chloroflexota bacterium]|nr:glycosyltransferase family 2 protein [Chloroflexota bacterium]
MRSDQRRESQDSDGPTLSIVVPVYNEGALVVELVERIVRVVRHCADTTEILFVNDGSSDDTLPRLVRLSTQIPELKVIDLTRNFGHMSALMAGLEAARGEAVVVMDGDLQDPPELIKEMVQRWQEGAHLVLAHRSSRGEGAVRRVMTSVFYSFLSRLTKGRIPGQVGTFSLLDRQCVTLIRQFSESQRFFAGMRAWIGYEPAIVEYDRPERAYGRSRVGLRGALRLARVGLLSFSELPLRLTALLAMAGAVTLALFGIAVIIIKLASSAAIPGWASTMVLIGFVASLQSACLAVMSEYLAILFVEIKRRPDGVVKDVYQHGAALRPQTDNVEVRALPGVSTR